MDLATSGHLARQVVSLIGKWRPILVSKLARQSPKRLGIGQSLSARLHMKKEGARGTYLGKFMRRSKSPAAPHRLSVDIENFIRGFQLST
jgi:hypothetical protein